MIWGNFDVTLWHQLFFLNSLQLHDILVLLIYTYEIHVFFIKGNGEDLGTSY